MGCGSRPGRKPTSTRSAIRPTAASMQLLLSSRKTVTRRTRRRLCTEGRGSRTRTRPAIAGVWPYRRSSRTRGQDLCRPPGARTGLRSRTEVARLSARPSVVVDCPSAEGVGDDRKYFFKTQQKLFKIKKETSKQRSSFRDGSFRDVCRDNYSRGCGPSHQPCGWPRLRWLRVNYSPGRGSYYRWQRVTVEDSGPYRGGNRRRGHDDGTPAGPPMRTIPQDAAAGSSPWIGPWTRPRTARSLAFTRSPAEVCSQLVFLLRTSCRT